MKLKDISRKEILEMALEALPNSNEGYVIVTVDVRNGDVEVLSKTHHFEDWAATSSDFKKVLFGIKKESAAGQDIDTLYKRHKFEICCSIMEVKEDFPHLA